MKRALITDYAWNDLDIERSVLAENDIELVVAPAGDVATLSKLAADCDAIMTNWAKVPEAVIAACSRCQIVARLGIGLDNIDVAYATGCGIVVTNCPDYCLVEVAEHALALLLSLSRKVAYYHHATMTGTYDLRAGAALRRIEGQTLGIVGYGNIGQKLAEKARPLGLKIIATSRTKRGTVDGVRFVELNELLAASDYISLHVPATPETKHMLRAEQFSRMKPTAYLINTARGAVIDHAALADALTAGKLAGAALDVQDVEPPDLSKPPYNDPRVIITPHAAFVSVESLENLRRRVAQQVADRLHGRVPENVVNPAVLGK